jgi:hypothetical protein
MLLGILLFIQKGSQLFEGSCEKWVKKTGSDLENLILCAQKLNFQDLTPVSPAANPVCRCS